MGDDEPPAAGHPPRGPGLGRRHRLDVRRQHLLGQGPQVPVEPHREISWFHTLPLYVAGVYWTLIYDTLYGYQDRKDDVAIGVKSTSLFFGDNPQGPLSIISLGLLGGLLATGINSGLTAPYYVGVGGMWLHVLWQIWTADLDDKENLWRRFNSNKYSGGLLALAIAAGHF
mmetsp:Transcript_25744/g.36907  ORF Transcript_25744/g.36907 Transcript_25744/m.36907 type:complete len:171 (-) Transcript_25744:453-965(-)